MRGLFRSLALVFALAGLSSSARAQGEGQLFVIVHTSLDVQGIETGALADIFLGKRKFWSGDKKVEAVLRPASTDAGKRLFKDVLKMTPGRFTAHWNKIELAGSGMTPSTVASLDDAAALVASKPGGISVIDSAELVAAQKLRVKILPVARQP